MNKVTFILHKPQLSENIGACARAIKNFNFQKLYLIEPKPIFPNDLSWKFRQPYEVFDTDLSKWTQPPTNSLKFGKGGRFCFDPQPALDEITN